MIGYGEMARTQCEVVRLFRETHPDLPPLNQGTINKIEAQYREMGHVRKVPSKRQAVVDDDTKLNLLLALEENPITPARQLARDKGARFTVLFRIRLDPLCVVHQAGEDHNAEHEKNTSNVSSLADALNVWMRIFRPEECLVSLNSLMMRMMEKNSMMSAFSRWDANFRSTRSM
ncbi:hypothetical protein NQ318_008724 [Aromia moschata]|uniref:DUF4817 domain-containing protein n=1 Tax=Aromia moschata TaxID=1265417 RepID=A0AAV8XAR8_9CUCU|nr:hypothetical protein NQ318_008724 [Aromia moschata]